MSSSTTSGLSLNWLAVQCGGTRWALSMMSAEVPLAECAARSAGANMKLLDSLLRVVLACYVFISFLWLRCVLPV
jgi:hypothetical protein